MAVQVLTEHALITAALDRFLAVDPVRSTVLGTMRAALTADAWLATDGGSLLAARSSARFPLTIMGEWSRPALAELAVLVEGLDGLVGIGGQPASVQALAHALTGRGPATWTGQGLYRLDELTAPTPLDGGPVTAQESHLPLVRSWFGDFLAELGDRRHRGSTADAAVRTGRCRLWVRPDAEPVSMAMRHPAACGSARVAVVFTPEQYRGHGYAAAVTAAVTRDVLDNGDVPVLFTDLANPTSNKIYRQIGYRLVDQHRTVTFD